MVVVVARRGTVVGVVGVAKTPAGSVGDGVSGTVGEGLGRTVVAVESSLGVVVVVAVAAVGAPLEVDPDPDVAPEDEPDDATVDAGARALPARLGTVPGGVSSGGLALLMNRLKICAGREPPLTFATPWML
jgi:hypothetical protein